LPKTSRAGTSNGILGVAGAPRSQTILVTGATGFVGGQLARRLRLLGYSVRALVRPNSKVQPLVDLGVELYPGNLTRAHDVARAAEGVYKIFHLAALYRAAGLPDSDYYDVNLGGTENILNAARRHGVERVVHCSSAGVHGHVQGAPCTEESPLCPEDIYQQTKLAGELRAREAFARGVPGTVVRPAAVYGPGDTRLLKLFRTIHGGSFRMFGSGEVCYHLIYIDDVIDGMVLCGERPEALGEIFILAGPRYVQLNEMASLVAAAVGVEAPQRHLPMWPLMAAAVACEAVCRSLGLEPPLYRRRADFFRKNRAFSSEKARRVLGFLPKVEPAEGLCRAARWYFENRFLREPRRQGAA